MSLMVVSNTCHAPLATAPIVKPSLDELSLCSAELMLPARSSVAADDGDRDSCYMHAQYMR